MQVLPQAHKQTENLVRPSHVDARSGADAISWQRHFKVLSKNYPIFPLLMEYSQDSSSARNPLLDAVAMLVGYALLKKRVWNVCDGFRYSRDESLFDSGCQAFIYSLCTELSDAAAVSDGPAAWLTPNTAFQVACSLESLAALKCGKGKGTFLDKQAPEIQVCCKLHVRLPTS